MIGTGAISHKHAQVYKKIGFELTVCTDIFEPSGRKFADQYGAEFVPHLRRGVPPSQSGLRGRVHVPGLPHAADRDLRADQKARAGAEADLDQPGDGAADDRDGAARRHPARRGQPAPLRRRQPVPGEGHRRRPAGQAAAGRLLREVVPLRRILLAAHQGKLADRRRRRADQPGDPPDRHPALAGRAGARSIRRLAVGRAAQDRIRGRGERRGAIRERRDRRDPGLDGVLAGLSGAHRVSRHQGHGGDHGRQADHLGRGERRGRSGPGGARSGVRRVGPDGDFARAVRTPVPGFRRRHRQGTEAAGGRRRRLPGAGAGGRHLPLLPQRRRKSRSGRKAHHSDQRDRRNHASSAGSFALRRRPRRPSGSGGPPAARTTSSSNAG